MVTKLLFGWFIKGDTLDVMAEGQVPQLQANKFNRGIFGVPRIPTLDINAKTRGIIKEDRLALARTSKQGKVFIKVDEVNYKFRFEVHDVN